MPPKSKKPRPKFIHKRHEHCLVWTGGGGEFIIRCAHCEHVQARIDVSLTYDEELIRYAVECSRFQHKQNKHVPVKDPAAVAIRKHFSPERIAQMSYNPMAR